MCHLPSRRHPSVVVRSRNGRPCSVAGKGKTEAIYVHGDPINRRDPTGLVSRGEPGATPIPTVDMHVYLERNNGSWCGGGWDCQDLLSDRFFATPESGGCHYSRIAQERANEISREVSERGYFQGKGEPDWLYQLNSDPNLVVTINAEMLSVTAYGPWVPDSKGGYQSPGYVNEEYDVYGQVTISIDLTELTVSTMTSMIMICMQTLRSKVSLGTLEPSWWATCWLAQHTLRN